jgi:two-component system nitrogen regulation response regulator NtrX
VNKTAHVLIAEDDHAFTDELAKTLSSEGYEISCARDGAEALRLLSEKAFDVGLIDLAMPGVDGLEVLNSAAELYPTIPLIMITGYATIEHAIRATRLGAFDFIEKPFSIDRLLLTIERALEKKKLLQTNRWMAQEILSRYQMVGASPAMQQVYERIERISSSDSTVLITGDTGTGKDLAARAVHMRSRRSNGPFVRVNCAAIPDTLIESELFGYKKGAFTNALRDYAGKFEQANGGTIFLDEIGDLSPSAQAKVLRTLQDHEVTPLGSLHTLTVNVRVITATNKNLLQLIAEKQFREDLYYRICVVELQMPGLQDRLQDIPVLAHHFLRQFCDQHNRAIRDFEPAGMQLLLQHTWPGHIRQLRTVIERLVLYSNSDMITARLVDSVLHPDRPSDNLAIKSLHEAKAEFEADYIQKVLLMHNYNMQATAESLGIDRTNLFKKMQRLGIHKFKNSSSPV